MALLGKHGEFYNLDSHGNRIYRENTDILSGRADAENVMTENAIPETYHCANF